MAPTTHAQVGVSAKLKAKKVQGNLVPAFSPMGAPGTGNDDQDSPAILQTTEARTNCTFDSGKFKMQVGKDGSIKMKGVTCGGMPFTGTLCAHTKVLSSIMNSEIDKDGMSSAKTCITNAMDVAGKTNWSSGNVGTLTCSAGKCDGTLPVVTTDPCPDVDKVAELRAVEVFSGPDLATQVVMGTTLKVCCGPGQKIAGPIVPGSPCDVSTQDAIAEMGTVTQGQ
jgi:hypothetical protein